MKKKKVKKAVRTDIATNLPIIAYTSLRNIWNRVEANEYSKRVKKITSNTPFLQRVYLYVPIKNAPQKG